MTRLLLSLLTGSLLLACSAGGHSSGPESDVPMEVTLKADQGVVFETGEVKEGGPPFSKTDLYAVANNNALQLRTGAAKITEDGSPVTWFLQGGIPKKWNSLEQVPKTTPSPDLTAPLQSAQQGIGFVAKNYLSDGYTRGWIKAATSASIVIVYQPN